MTATKRDYCNGGYDGYQYVGYTPSPWVEGSAQTFTASATYTPASIKLNLMNSGGYGPPYPAIYAWIATLAGVRVAIGTIDTSSISLGGFTTITTPITTVDSNVQSGTQYYLFVTSSLTNSGLFYVQKSYMGYAGGQQLYLSGGLDATWSVLPENDLWFEIWGSEPVLTKAKYAHYPLRLAR